MQVHKDSAVKIATAVVQFMDVLSGIFLPLIHALLQAQQDKAERWDSERQAGVFIPDPFKSTRATIVKPGLVRITAFLQLNHACLVAFRKCLWLNPSVLVFKPLEQLKTSLLSAKDDTCKQSPDLPDGSSFKQPPVGLHSLITFTLHKGQVSIDLMICHQLETRQGRELLEAPCLA